MKNVFSTWPGETMLFSSSTRFNPYQRTVSAVSWSPDGSKLVSIYGDFAMFGIGLWNAKNGTRYICSKTNKNVHVQLAALPPQQHFDAWPSYFVRQQPSFGLSWVASLLILTNQFFLLDAGQVLDNQLPYISMPTYGPYPEWSPAGNFLAVSTSSNGVAVFEVTEAGTDLS